jgi:hypothetical protein
MKAYISASKESDVNICGFSGSLTKQFSDIFVKSPVRRSA